MFKSLKTSIKVMMTLLVIITFVTAEFVVTYTMNEKVSFEFNTPSLISIGVLVVIALIIATDIGNKVVFPLKKIEKSMRHLAEGKTVDTKSIKTVTSPNEIVDLITVYDSMVDIVSKQNFDLNSQQSKTQIILERMDDGVIAFSLQRKVIHMNTAAKNFIGLTDQDDTYDKVCRKLGIKIDFDKVIYISDYNGVLCYNKLRSEDNISLRNFLCR